MIKIDKLQIIIGMGIVILLLLSVIMVPKILEPFRNKYMEEGCNTCANQILIRIITDLQNQGYTLITVGNQTIPLTIVE